MTALQLGNIPDGINTVEKLNVWSSTVLQHLNPDTTVIEIGGSLDRAILAQPWFISASNPPTWRYIARSSIQLSPTGHRGGKIWTYALDLNSAAIPSEFLSN